MKSDSKTTFHAGKNQACFVTGLIAPSSYKLNITVISATTCCSGPWRECWGRSQHSLQGRGSRGRTQNKEWCNPISPSQAQSCSLPPAFPPPATRGSRCGNSSTVGGGGREEGGKPSPTSSCVRKGWSQTPRRLSEADGGWDIGAPKQFATFPNSPPEMKCPACLMDGQGLPLRSFLLSTTVFL